MKRRYVKSRYYQETNEGFFVLNKKKIFFFIIFIIFFLIYLFSLAKFDSLNINMSGKVIFSLFIWPLIVFSNNYISLIIAVIWFYVLSCLIAYFYDFIKKR